MARGRTICDTLSDDKSGGRHEVKGSQRVLERKPFPLRYTLGIFKFMVLTDEKKNIPDQVERGNFPSLPNCRQVIPI